MDAEGAIVIPRPRPVVARYLFDLANAPQWALGVKECRPLSPGPLRPGMFIEQRMAFSKSMTMVYEIVSFDPERFIELRITDPYEMWLLQELEDAPGGTLVRFRTKRVTGDPTFFRIFGGILNLLTKRNVRRDLRSLSRAITALPQ